MQGSHLTKFISRLPLTTATVLTCPLETCRDILQEFLISQQLKMCEISPKKSLLSSFGPKVSKGYLPFRVSNIRVGALFNSPNTAVHLGSHKNVSSKFLIKT